MARRERTLADVGRVIGVSSAGMSRRLNGQTPISVPELISIAEYLGVTASVLLGEDHTPERVAS